MIWREDAMNIKRNWSWIYKEIYCL